MKSSLSTRFKQNYLRAFILTTVIAVSFSMLFGVSLVFGSQQRTPKAAANAMYIRYMPFVLNNGVPGSGAPTITAFVADDATIIEGESVALRWEVTGVVSDYTISPAPESIQGNQATVRPTETTTYSITVSNSAGSDTADLTITVFSPDGPAVVSDFSTADAIIAPGESTTLTWDVDGVLNSLELSPGVGSVPQQASIVVTPTESTTYTLSAVNKFGTTTAELLIQVIAPPTISTFDPSPQTVNLGEQTTLSWTTEGVIDTATLDPGNIDVTGLSDYTLTPDETAVYTLTVENLNGTAQSQTQIVVYPPPEIAAFGAQANSPLYVGDLVTLTWSIINEPTTLNVSPDIGDVMGLNSVVVTANIDMTYTLVASNSAGSDIASLSLDVVEAPIIDTFTASTELAYDNEAVTLTWSVTGENVSLWMTQGVGDVTGLSQVVVTPTQNTKYTLIATNGSGSATASVNVDYASGDSQITFYSWNKVMTVNHHGFANDNSPDENYDWTSPVNYAEGTIYVRAEVISQPVEQPKMRMQLCIWQDDLIGNPLGLETCIPTRIVAGVPGTVVCWSKPINEMWKKNGNPIDWTRPRARVGVPIKNEFNLPVSDYNGWNWNGEDPNEWYPLNFKFTAIVVAKNHTFTGFDDCVVEE